MEQPTIEYIVSKIEGHIYLPQLLIDVYNICRTLVSVNHLYNEDIFPDLDETKAKVIMPTSINTTDSVFREKMKEKGYIVEASSEV